MSCTNKCPQQDTLVGGVEDLQSAARRVHLRASSDSSCKEEHLERKVLLTRTHIHAQSLNLNVRLALTLLSHTFADAAILNCAQFFTNYKSMRYKSAF